MAKRRTNPRRVPRATAPRMYGDGKPSSAEQQPLAQPGASDRAALPARPAGAPRVPVTVTQDYRYVVRDLRHLGIIAVATFALLIVLGLFIR